MMSKLGEPELKHLLAITDLRPYTPQTVYEPAKIVERVKAARAKGYILSMGDYFPNDISICSPIISSGGQLMGAVSLAVSTERYTPKDAEAKFAKLVKAAAKLVVVEEVYSGFFGGAPLQSCRRSYVLT